MAFRFRKTIRLGKGLKLNLSKSGISASVGKPGATLNFGKRGARTTVGLPGTGLSYSSQLGSTPNKTQSTTFKPLPPSNSRKNNGCLGSLFGMIVMPFRVVADIIRSLIDPRYRRSTITIFGIVFALCLVVSGVSSLGDSVKVQPTTAPTLSLKSIQNTAWADAWLSFTKTSAALPTATPAPTNTLLPTNTPAPLPTFTLQPTSTTAPTWTPYPTATVIIFVPIIPTQPPSNPNPSSPSVCSCSGNTLNCSDFSTHSSAQVCYNYCVSIGAGDIHRLDGDGNGSACESLP
jgi:hypothetical protein